MEKIFFRGKYFLLKDQSRKKKTILFWVKDREVFPEKTRGIFLRCQNSVEYLSLRRTLSKADNSIRLTVVLGTD